MRKRREGKGNKKRIGYIYYSKKNGLKYRVKEKKDITYTLLFSIILLCISGCEVGLSTDDCLKLLPSVSELKYE